MASIIDPWFQPLPEFSTPRVITLGRPFSPYSSPTAAPAPVLSPSAQSAATGIEPQALDAILYGKEIPIFVGGKALMGSRVIEGPFFGGSTEAPTVSVVYSHALAANPGGTRTITEFLLRGRTAWTLADGPLMAGVDVEFRTGTEDQEPFTDSITRNGSAAIAYRSHILSTLRDLPLTTFAGIVPFASAMIEDSSFGDPADGITRNDALEVLLRYALLEDDEFEVNVSGSDPAWIVAQKSDLIGFLKGHRKIFSNWNITSTDKLRIIEKGPYSPDVTITRGNTLAKSLRFVRTDPGSKTREKIYKFIDVNRDYEPNSAVARMERFPTPTTASIESETIELPIVTTAEEAMADVNFALFAEEVARKKFSFTGLVPLFGTEAGDNVFFEPSGMDPFRGRATEVVLSLNNFTNNVKSEAVLNCEFEAEPVEPYEAGAVHFDGDVFLQRGADLTGVADSSTFIFSVWLKGIAAGDPQTIIHSSPNFNFYIERNAGIFVNIFNAADPGDHSVTWGRNGAFTAAAWTNVIFCGNAAVDIGDPDQTNLKVLINGVEVPLVDFGQAGDPPSAFTIGFSSNETDFLISEFYEGDMTELYFGPGQWLDFDDPANVAKFIAAGKPVDLGADGSTPTGTAPAIYMRGGASTFATNLGTGGAFSTIDGPLTDASTSPSD